MDYTVVRNFPRGFREKRSRGIVSFAVQGNKKIRVREERKNRRIYMRRVIERKGQKINGGRPIVCVPVMAERVEEILRQARILSAGAPECWSGDWTFLRALEIRSASEGS